MLDTVAMLGARKADCPNCGGPIEWKVGHSVSTICKWCSFSVVRSDRDVRAIGKVADLVPTAAPIAVGDHGKITLDDGSVVGFQVAGRLQLDHGKGPWDEWYISMARNQWGWLARAQGRWYLTRPQPVTPVPPLESLRVGFTGQLNVNGTPGEWVVAELGNSTVVSAEGELPVALSPGQQGRYADLQGANEGFGTIDYGDGSTPAATYFGHRLAASGISWKDGGQGPRPTEQVDVSKLECPGCGAPVEIHAPQSTERAACTHCNGLLDYQSGNLALITTLRQERITPAIPLGQQGTLRGQALTVIGFMERYTVVEGITYAWREYLLYTGEGYRWLMEDSGHWTLLSDVSAADIQDAPGAKTFGGNKYKLFGVNRVVVRYVAGEFYWKVSVGDHAKTVDYIDPPRLLSEERTQSEMTWSHGEYVPHKEIEKAFSPPNPLQKPYDVAPAQPNPVGLTYPAVVTAIFAALLVGVYLSASAARPTEKIFATVSVPMPPLPSPSYVLSRGGLDPKLSRTSTDQTSDLVSFSEPFTLESKTENLQLQLQSTLGSGWIGVAVAVIHDESGEVWEASLENGEGFHESRADLFKPQPLAVKQLGTLPAGRYVVRTESKWSRKTAISNIRGTPPESTFVVVRSFVEPVDGGCLCVSIFLLCCPLAIALIRRRAFESRRWRNANLGGS